MAEQDKTKSCSVPFVLFSAATQVGSVGVGSSPHQARSSSFLRRGLAWLTPPWCVSCVVCRVSCVVRADAVKREHGRLQAAG